MLSFYCYYTQVNFESVVTTGDKLPFYNNGPTEMMLNLVRRELMIKHKWRRVGILSSIGSYSIVRKDKCNWICKNPKQS